MTAQEGVLSGLFRGGRHGRVQRQARVSYAMRSEPPAGRLERLAARVVSPLSAAGGSWTLLRRFVREVHRHAPQFQDMTDAQIRQQATELGYRLKASGMARGVVAEAFALVREAAGRRLGMPHFDVQLAGGWAMFNGMVAEMQTGEGKTLAATLPACAAALAGIPVHVITVNDYLAGRDAENMRPVYEMLGLSCGAALADMSDKQRQAAYRCDITYATNKQVAFDHLRDRLKLRNRESQLGLAFAEERDLDLLLRGLHFAIVDEADSVLVDEAATPLIISRQGKPLYAEEILVQALEFARRLRAGVDYVLIPRERNLRLLPPGEKSLLSWSHDQHGLWRNSRYREQLVTQALRALFLFERDRHYLVDENKVKIIDEFTGRLMADRSWEQGLHQLIEVKEGCAITGEMETIGRISYQAFFRRYLMLGGMSGTIQEVAGELRDVYGVRVARIPTHRPARRKAFAPGLTLSRDAKWERVVERVRQLQNQGRPVLVGTRSVGASEHISALLRAAGIEHRVLNARQDAGEAEIIADAGRAQQVTVATNMAGRGTDIKLAEGVAERGGLHVIATEKHESRRIDRQLFGRCGRQGDPGSFEQLASLGDDLFLVHASRPAYLLARLLLGTGGRRSERLALQVLGMAQRRAEAEAGRVRGQMQKMDEYLGTALAFTGRLE